MQWINDNWSFLVVVICAVALMLLYLRKFTALPSGEQLMKVKEWLLWAVIMAERDFGSGTGALKLRYVYDLFLERFPGLASMISFDTFSKLVDEALKKMNHILETNKDIDCYVKGGEG